jgi:hypothetical protein
LGCAFMRKQIQQGIKSENLIMLESAEPGTITFKVESLICKILSYNANSHQVKNPYFKVTTVTTLDFNYYLYHSRFTSFWNLTWHFHTIGTQIA